MLTLPGLVLNFLKRISLEDQGLQGQHFFLARIGNSPEAFVLKQI